MSVFNALESIPEWWKEHYNVPANDDKWTGLTSETAHEDYLRYIARYSLNLMRDRFGYRAPQKATIMDKTVEEMKQEVEHVKEWITDGDIKLKEAMERSGSDKKMLEKEMFGRELTDAEKETMIQERVLKVMREEYGMSV
jgi:hypothetical protein